MCTRRAAPTTNCVRRWPSNAISARAIATRRACRRAPPGRQCAFRRYSSSGPPRRFYDDGYDNMEQPTQRTVRRIWRTPGSVYNWLFLALSIIILGWVYLFYRLAVATPPYPGPYNVPFRAFGIVSFGLVMVVGAYTLRRRFARRLPGKVQNWLWLHTWLGVISVLIAFMHDNLQNITHDFMFDVTRFSEYGYGTTAMYALLVLVVTGVVGRLLDMWQARVIAAEADTNGVGIARSLEDRLFEIGRAHV